MATTDTTRRGQLRPVVRRGIVHRADLARWRPSVVRWLGATALAAVLALLVLVGSLGLSHIHATQVAFYLALSGLVSILAGGAALWLADMAHIGSTRLKLAVPSILAALVIGWNVVLVSHMMFLSPIDSELVLVFLLFGECIALALSSSIAGAMTASIRRIEGGARRIAVGEYGIRLPEEAQQGVSSELDRLAHWFNVMADSVQGAFARQRAAEAHRRQLTAALSHDVRTPLASIRAMIEALDDGVITEPATVRRYQSAIRAEIHHLGTLVDDLFEVSRLEAGAVPLERERMDLRDLISDALEASHEQAAQRGIQLSGSVEGELPGVYADARQVYRVLTNLVQNALRYTPEGGVVLLRAMPAEGGRAVLVQISDSGEGIRPDDLPHIFESAYRGEAARTRRSGAGGTERASGAGLGLAIASGLVKAHGGRIWADSPLPEAARAALTASALATSRTDGPLAAAPGTLVSFVLPIEGQNR